MTDFPFRIFEHENGSIDIVFDCPGCNFPHSFRVAGIPSPWIWNGDLDRATFSPSLLVRFGDGPGDKRCHSYVRDGQIRFLDDCSHSLAGQTVKVPFIPEPEGV